MIDFKSLEPRGPIKPIPLVESDGLYLVDRGMMHDDALWQAPDNVVRKFCRSFRNTWGQIPSNDRARLLEYWNPRVETYPIPEIVLSDGQSKWGYYTASCREWGYQLDFDAVFVGYTKPKQLSNAIAHELGHALSHADGWFKQHACEAECGKECVACECRTFSYMAAWKFDPFLDLLPQRKRLTRRFYDAGKQRIR